MNWNIVLISLNKDAVFVSASSFSQQMNPNGIFANNELDLQSIKVYGFDFGLSLTNESRNSIEVMSSCFNLDYTLARYKSTLHSLIYDHAKTFLVKNFRVIAHVQTMTFIVIRLLFTVSG